MNSTDLSQLTIKELKSIALENGIKPLGDKRSKATWVNAIETFQSQPSPVIEITETLPAMLVPLLSLELPEVELPLTEAAVSPLPSPPSTTQHRGASIVILMPLILLFGAVMAIQMGLRLMTPLIVAVWRFMAAWRPVPRTARSTTSIDYFPTAPA